MLTAQETADLMKVHIITVRKWLMLPRSQVFPHAIKSPTWRGWRIPRSDVEALMKVRKQES